MRVLTSSPGAPGRRLCGAARSAAHPARGTWGDTERSRRRLCPVPSGAGGCLCLLLPALRVPGCRLESLRERRETLRGRQEGRQPLPGPGAISRDPRLAVRGDTVRISCPVCSAEVVALTVPGASHTPSEGPKRGTRSCGAARAGSARPSRVGSCHRRSSRVRTGGITALRRAPWSQSSWFAVPVNGCDGGGDALAAVCYALS